MSPVSRFKYHLMRIYCGDDRSSFPETTLYIDKFIIHKGFTLVKSAHFPLWLSITRSNFALWKHIEKVYGPLSQAMPRNV